MPETEVKEMLPPFTVEEGCFRVLNERKRRKERGAPSSLGKREKRHFSGINVMDDELQQTSIFELHYSIWRTFRRLESLTQK
ncbi:hypothetical protein Nepgr_022165 [Nepenthes gracilis]|uniref:Uncharacterized protein n=1 Tax=Nepenthes gracilis TaxID=150966 RepID=A0AAD3XXS8_NEPGR|nr:hypothetical protein Nepgr_022165 [Nepenthes gracilis]